MVLLPAAGEALAQDFLKLEARRSDLEDKRWRFLEEMQNRHTVKEQQRVASVGVLDRRLRAEEQQHSLLKERNSIIRQQAAALCNPSTSEVQQRTRAFRERFALDAERQSMDWNRHIETQLREEIALCRRDAQHCRQRQGEALEVAMQQEKLMVELAEAQGQAQEERAKLQEDVRIQQDRLRQRLFEQRQLMDDRVKALTSQGSNVGTPGFLGGPAQTLQPQDVNEGNLATPKSPGIAERTVLPAKKAGRDQGTEGYMPKEGTRQAEVYRQLCRNEAEMAADLRLMEDRLVLRCLHCGFVGAPPGPPNGLCEGCGHFIEVVRIPPKIAPGSTLQSPAKTPHSTLSSKVFSSKPPAPAFAVRGKTTSEVVTQPAGASLSHSQDVMQAAQELAARSLERLVARRQQRAAPTAQANVSPRVEEPGGLQPLGPAGIQDTSSASPEVTSLPTALRSSGHHCLLGDLGVLDMPLPPLPSHINTDLRRSSSQPRTLSGNDWYGSSSSTTPRTPRVADPGEKAEEQAETSSAEDIAFVEEAPDTAGAEGPLKCLDAPQQASLASDAATPLESQPRGTLGGPVTQPGQKGGVATQVARIPGVPSQLPSEARVETKEDAAHYAVKLDDEHAGQFQPHEPDIADIAEESGHTVEIIARPAHDSSAGPRCEVERPQEAPVARGCTPHSCYSELGKESPEDAALQVSSPGSFTFGGMASPPEAGDAAQDELKEGAQKTVEAQGPEGQSPAQSQSQATSQASRDSRERLAKDARMMSDLGLTEDGSEDEAKKAKDRSALHPSSMLGKQAPKRSNPLSRGRGSGIIQAGDSFVGPGAGISSLSNLSGTGSKPQISDLNKGLTQVPSLSKLKAARPKSSHQLFGGPIDWGQKEDFR